jgi:hypothetical protein
MSNKEKIDQYQSDNAKTSKEKKVKDQLEQLYLKVKNMIFPIIKIIIH